MALKRSTKIVITVAAVLVLTGVSLVGYGIWRAYSFFSYISSYHDRPLPPELAEPRVLSGDGFLTKKELFKKTTKSLSEITLKGSTMPEEDRELMTSTESAKSVYGFSDVKVCGDEIVAAGKFGAYVASLNGELKRFIRFEPLVDTIPILFWNKKMFRDTTDNLKIFDIEEDGRCEFHTNSSSDGLTLFDSNGTVKWRYRDLSLKEFLGKPADDSTPWVTDVSALDLDGDGRKELVLAIHKEGVRALTADQKELWFRTGGDVTDGFQLLDIDNDKKDELVSVIGGGSELMEKSTGKLIKKWELPSPTDGIMSIVTPDGKNELRLAGIYDRKFRVYDVNNEELVTVDAPLSEVNRNPDDKDEYSSSELSIYGGLIRPVSLRSGEAKFYVVLGRYIGYPRSQLYVYDVKGKLVYHEMLNEEAEAITTVDEGNNKQGFIIAGKDTVWRYSAL